VAVVTATAIVALDVANAADATALVRRLDGLCRFYKVGNELFTAAGPAIVDVLRELGADVFLDLKYHDIPNTVHGAVRQAAGLGARLLTVHASGGRASLEAAVQASSDYEGCGVIAVTVLTSLTSAALAAAWGRDRADVASEVLRLAGLAADVGAEGIVCSGREAGLVRERYGERLAVVVTGVRLADGAAHDQARVVTPSSAAKAGARYVVVGRSVTGAADPRAAMEQVLQQVS
jgi:orotidine-5'-phosphate decarboxylase